MSPPWSRVLALAALWAGPVRAGEAVVEWDLEDDDGGFVSTGVVPQWEWGEPVVGPSFAHGGDRVWGTDLDGLYLRENQVELTLPALDLATVEEPVLVLWSWLDLASGDVARFEVDDGSGWQTAAPVYGYPGEDSLVDADSEWSPLYLDLAGLDDASQVRLVLVSNEGRAWGWYVDDLGVWSGDAVPPRIDGVEAPTAWSSFDVGPTILADIVDDRALTSIVVVWSTDTIGETRTGFSADGEGGWTATLPAVPPGTLRWSIEASDGENIATWPSLGLREIAVSLPAPQALSGPAGRAWGSTVELDWQAPASDEPVLGYRVYRDGVLVAEPLAPPAQVPAVGPVDSFTVTALFQTALGDFEGDAAGPLLLDVAVPALQALEPAESWQGDRLRVVLTGSSLLLDASTLDPAALDLGEGVTVEEIDVEHVDRATFTLIVDESAPIGTRDAVLDLGDEQVLLEDAFTVQSGEDRPALLSISPSALEQGAEESLELTLNSPPAATPEVDLGEDVVIEAVTVDGNVLTVQVAVANGAALGTRDVLVDDGVRILELADGFRVWPLTQGVAPDCACGSAPGGRGRAPGAVLGLLFLASARRRRPTPR